MKHTLNMTVMTSMARRFPASLEFVWDDQTGAFEGPDAEMAEGILRMLVTADKKVLLRPPPGMFNLPDNYRLDMTSMAAIFGYAYKMPPELEEFYPRKTAMGETTTMGGTGMQIVY